MINDENREMVTIPYFVHEGMIVRWERNFKIVLAMLIGTILLLFATNMVWIYYWSQFDISNEEVRVDSDGGGDANYIGRDGEINYGKGDSKKIHTDETNKAQ